jgi:hypothetical protein
VQRRWDEQSQGAFAMHDLSRRKAIHLVLLLAAALFATAIPSVAAEKVPLAIEGYDPVAYFAIGKPARGLPCSQGSISQNS